MENSDARPVARRVRCPRCQCVLEEPGAPVYQCGGCGTTLRAKNRTGNTGDDVARGSPSSTRSVLLPPQSRHLDSTDVASTSRSSTPTSLDAAATSRHQQATTDTTSRREPGDLVSARRHGSGDVASTSSTPTAAASSRRHGTQTRSQGESGDLVSARRHHGSGDGASTSSTPTPRSRQGMDTGSRRDSGDVASTSSTPGATSSRRHGTDTRNRVSEQVALIEKMEHDDQAAANHEVLANSEGRRRARDAGATSANVSVHFARGDRDEASELKDDAEKGMKRQAESPDAARKKHSGEEEPAPKSAQAPAGDVLRKEDDAAAAGEKVLSPSRNELQAQNLGPLRKKILKTVDELKDDLSELFSKSPEQLNPTPRARPPRLPNQEQEGYASRTAVGSGFPAAVRARRTAAAAATDGHRGSAARVVKHGQGVAAAAPPRGLPSRRYRQCRADPCCHSVQPRSCHHHGCCCRHHGKPECSSCRGHCCRPRTQEPSAPPPRKPPAAREAKRRLPPRNHCRPVLKGAPFIVCSSCFKLVQVPADFAVATKTVRQLRCGSCSTVLSYSYRDPARKKAYQDSLDDQLSADDGSKRQGGKGRAGAAQPDPFAPFVDGFGLSSYSTDDEQPLNVSRNTSLGSIDGAAKGGVGRLHRLMGYGSASELLRHSPDLYESFSERTTPDVGHYDRKGKGVCVDDDVYDVDDSDEEDMTARGALPGMLGKGIVPAPGAIRIK